MKSVVETLAGVPTRCDVVGSKQGNFPGISISIRGIEYACTGINKATAIQVNSATI